MADTSKKVRNEGKDEELEQKCEVNSRRINGRKLKKIRHQMEFYFSDANLRRDRMLWKVIQESTDRYVDFQCFMSFNKIRNMTDNVRDLVKACLQSNQLEVDESGTKVRRKFPFLFKSRNVDELTVYVERIPPHADHKFIKNVLQRFGKVAYVSIPFFRNSNKNKGYAFVEFESEEAVKLACEVYGDEEESEDACDSCDDKPVEGSEGDMNLNESADKPNPRKRRISEKEEKHPAKVSKMEKHAQVVSSNTSDLTVEKSLLVKHSEKRKQQSFECERPTKKSKMASNSTLDPKHVSKTESNISNPSVSDEDNKDTSETQIEMSSPICDENAVSQVCDNEDTTFSDTKSINKRKRKKVADPGKLNLRVMSMAEWKVYRNKYLAMQRKAMTAIKRMFLLDRQQRTECESVLTRPSSTKVTRHNDSHTVARSSDNKSYMLQDGVVVKVVTFEKLELEHKELRDKVKAAVSNVAYVDTTSLEELKIYIRFHSPESASSATKSDFLNKLGSCEILMGDEQSSYWEKLELDRHAQRNRERPKIRGRDKILAKAKLLTKNSHIFFN